MANQQLQDTDEAPPVAHDHQTEEAGRLSSITVWMLLSGVAFVAALVMAGKYFGIVSWPWTWILFTLYPLLLALMTAISLLAIFFDRNTTAMTTLIGILVWLWVLLGIYCFSFGTLMIQHNQEQRVLISPNSVETQAKVTAIQFKGLVNYQGEFTVTLQISPQDSGTFFAKKTVIGNGSSQDPPYPVGTTLDVKYDPNSHRVAIVGPVQ